MGSRRGCSNCGDCCNKYLSAQELAKIEAEKLEAQQQLEAERAEKATVERAVRALRDLSSKAEESSKQLENSLIIVVPLSRPRPKKVK